MSTGSPPAGSTVFIERRQPALLAGTYTVEVSHRVVSRDGTTIPATDPSATFSAARQTLAVRGERFSLDPNELAAVFPPRDNTGAHDNVLPHVMFSRATLPWERRVGPADDDRFDGATWLALLLFDEGEAPAPRTGTLVDLFGGLPAGAASYRTAFPTGAPFALEFDEAISDPCTTIDVPAALFTELAPSVADLKLLAHVRWTGAPGEVYDGVSSASEESAVLIANRLPVPGGRSTVHLVSLEGLAPLLRLDSSSAAPDLRADVVRLMSLANWSFTSAEETTTFAGYLEHVEVDSMRRPTGTATSGQAAIERAFGLGFTALPHTTRLADTTVSWYRGPLAPEPVDPAIVPPPDAAGDTLLAVADAALRFDPATGMFDVSYAAAWQLGRLLALASPTFATSMVNWRRALLAATSASVATRSVTPHVTPSVIVGPAPAPAPAPAPTPAPAPAPTHSPILAAAVDAVLARLAPGLVAAASPVERVSEAVVGGAGEVEKLAKQAAQGVETVAAEAERALTRVASEAARITTLAERVEGRAAQAAQADKAKAREKEKGA